MKLPHLPRSLWLRILRLHSGWVSHRLRIPENKSGSSYPVSAKAAACLLMAGTMGFLSAGAQEAAVNSSSKDLITICCDHNHHNSFSSALELPLQSLVKGVLKTPAAQDYYKCVVEKTGILDLSLTGLPADYDLKVYNNLLKQVAVSQNSGNHRENINYTAVPGTYYIRVYGYNQAFNPNRNYDLKIQEEDENSRNAGLTDETNVIKIFPNPAESVINISACKLPAASVIKVFDMHGKTVISETASPSKEVDIRELNPGSYFVQIQDEDDNVAYSTKFVKD